MAREKTKGEVIAERLEKEADEMIQQVQDSQTESDSEAKGLAIPEAEEVQDTPEEVVEEAENTPEESAETVEASNQEEEIQEDDTKSDKGLLTSEQWEERYKNAQAKMTKETQRAKELESKIAEMSNKITAMEALKSEPKIEEAKEEVSVDLSEIIKDYPEIVKPLQKYVDARFAQMDQKVSATTQEVLAARKEEEDKKHFDAIASAHPDYATVSNSPDFRIWLERQTKMWREVAVEGETQDVISLLSKYKKDLGIDSNTVSKEELVEKAKQNVEPTLSKARKQNIGSSKKIWSRSEIDKLSDKQYKKFEKDIDKAYTEGRIKP